MSAINDKSNAIICTGFPVYSDFSTEGILNNVHFIKDFKKIRLLGSAALSLCLVSKGSVEAYHENNIAMWDVAAGIAIVIAAGGKCDIEEGKNKHLLNVFAYNGLINR